MKYAIALDNSTIIRWNRHTVWFWHNRWIMSVFDKIHVKCKPVSEESAQKQFPYAFNEKSLEINRRSNAM